MVCELFYLLDIACSDCFDQLFPYIAFFKHSETIPAIYFNENVHAEKMQCLI